MANNKPAIKQTRPFHAVIPEAFKRALCAEAQKSGIHYGVFFDTSGKVRTEQLNPGRQYEYIWQTDNET